MGIAMNTEIQCDMCGTEALLNTAWSVLDMLGGTERRVTCPLCQRVLVEVIDPYVEKVIQS
jgi:uncharacterized Zn-finger protein